MVETHLRQSFVYNKYMQFLLKNQYNSTILSKYKPPKEFSLRGLKFFSEIVRSKNVWLTFWELWCSTSCFKSVLKCSYVRFSLRFRAFWAFPLKVAPLFNHKMGTSDARFYYRNAAFTTLTSSSGLLYFTWA